VLILADIEVVFYREGPDLTPFQAAGDIDAKCDEKIVSIV